MSSILQHIFLMFYFPFNNTLNATRFQNKLRLGLRLRCCRNQVVYVRSKFVKNISKSPLNYQNQVKLFNLGHGLC
jgi:hypothetical protein